MHLRHVIVQEGMWKGNGRSIYMRIGRTDIRREATRSHKIDELNPQRIELTRSLHDSCNMNLNIWVYNMLNNLFKQTSHLRELTTGHLAPNVSSLTRADCKTKMICEHFIEVLKPPPHGAIHHLLRKTTMKMQYLQQWLRSWKSF